MQWILIIFGEVRGKMISIYFLAYFTFSIFYIMFGVYVFLKDKHSNINKAIFLISFSLFVWAIGYAFMFKAPNIYTANLWRLVAASGWCFFFAIWVDLAILIKNKDTFKADDKTRLLLYLPPLVFYLKNLAYEPATVLYQLNGNWADRYPVNFIQILFDVYYIVSIIAGLWLFYRFGKESNLKREKKQAKIIIITTSITFISGFTTDTLLPLLNIKVLPLAIGAVPIGLLGVWYSITKYKMITMTHSSKYLFINIYEYLYKIVNDPIFVLGQDFRIEKVNDIARELVGEVLGKSFDSLITGPVDLRKNLLQQGSIYNLDVYFKNNNLLEYELSGKVIYDEFNDLYSVLIILHDISERKKKERILKEYNYQLENEVNKKIKELEEEIFNRTNAENKILYLGYHDELTGLPNRRYFNEFITKLVKNIKEEDDDEYFIIMFLDLDNFKLINDTYGHQNGDKVLIYYANMIRKVLRKNDIVARIGGDEFLILVTNLSKGENANVIESLSKKILRVFDQPFIIEDREYFLTASIGVALYPDDGLDADTLIMNADIAMYEAKNSGKNNIKLCTEEIKNKVFSNTILRNSLYNALSKKELSIFYQPQVDINLQEIIGFEALLRWKLNDENYISPAEFIPLAEDTGLIVPIGYWVIKTACKDLQRWNSSGSGNLFMAINLSINQLNERDFYKKVAKIIKETGINPSLLEFEITERIILKGNVVAEKNLKEIKQLGIKISIDDFGMEYSSFINIKKPYIDKIKIAMEFIQGLKKNQKDNRDNLIVNSIIALSHNLNLTVIAEGVETKEQLEYLRYLQCDEIQGYYYYKPVPDIEIERILNQQDNISNLSVKRT